MSSVFSLEGNIQSLAVANDFVVTLNKACFALGKAKRPFGFYNSEEKRKYQVIDFVDFQGVINPQNSLESEIVTERLTQLKSGGVTLNTAMQVTNKTLVLDYLLSTCVCYCETPKTVVKKSGGVTKTYDKYFATKNPRLMALWVNQDINIIQAKYSSKCRSTGVELGENKLRLAKLNRTSTGGTSITIPRSAVESEQMTVYPLFSLYAFEKGLEESLNKEIVQFTYLKDNGTERVVPTTLNKDILYDYYSEDKDFVDRGYSQLSWFDTKIGGMTLSSTQNRGYVRAFEIGTSRFDSSGTRSINLARLLKVETVDSVSREFINVDLDSTPTAFEDGLNKLLVKNPEQVRQLYTEATGVSPKSELTDVQVATELRKWLETQVTILSTSFKRELHRFMVSHPQWYGTYTGLPLERVSVDSSEFGVESMPF